MLCSDIPREAAMKEELLAAASGVKQLLSRASIAPSNFDAEKNMMAMSDSPASYCTQVNVCMVEQHLLQPQRANLAPASFIFASRNPELVHALICAGQAPKSSQFNPE